MISLEEIRRRLGEHRQQLQVFGVDSLALFGSLSRGEPDANDLDFMATFKSPPTLSEFMGLKFFLEDLFGRDVDLVSRRSCPERFMKRIQKDLQDVA